MLFTYQNLLSFLITTSSWSFWYWFKKESLAIWFKRMTWKIKWIFMNVERFNSMIRKLFLKTCLILKKSTLWSFNLTVRWVMLRLQTFNQTSSSTKYLKQEWQERLSLISTCFYNVWVKMSAESSSRFRMSWFSWDSTSSTLNSLIFRFMKAKICKNVEIIENRCNWIESRMMIYDWNFMTLMSKMLKMKFSIILRFKIWVFRIVWCWY